LEQVRYLGTGSLCGHLIVISATRWARGFLKQAAESREGVLGVWS
jgi:hypothetical protein